MSFLHRRIVEWWTIQLPHSFRQACSLPYKKFCTLFPKRHAARRWSSSPWFSLLKGDAEKRFNHWLIEEGINRIIMDSRPVFSATNTEAVIDAHQKKPRVPDFMLLRRQAIRWFALLDIQIEAISLFFKPWFAKLPTWLNEGKQPYLMIHTPDNNHAPELAIAIYKQLQTQVAEHTQITLPNLAEFPAQVTIKSRCFDSKQPLTCVHFHQSQFFVTQAIFYVNASPFIWYEFCADYADCRERMQWATRQYLFRSHW